jgi:hypothetical protein
LPPSDWMSDCLTITGLTDLCRRTTARGLALPHPGQATLVLSSTPGRTVPCRPRARGRTFRGRPTRGRTTPGASVPARTAPAPTALGLTADRPTARGPAACGLTAHRQAACGPATRGRTVPGLTRRGLLTPPSRAGHGRVPRCHATPCWTASCLIGLGRMTRRGRTTSPAGPARRRSTARGPTARRRAGPDPAIAGPAASGQVPPSPVAAPRAAAAPCTAP